MAPLEPWEKVLVNADKFTDTVHGRISCDQCHAGDVNASEKETAHIDLVSRPSEDSQEYCGECHPDLTEHFSASLHASQTGYWAAIEARSGETIEDQMVEMFGNHCSSCHTTCGDCHVSQPNSVGGGLINGHVFNMTPSLSQNCTACHGSRVGNEYMGKNEGLVSDVHFRKGRMTCVDCHTSQEMHGLPYDCEDCHASIEDEFQPLPQHRYDGVQSPRCETCHITASIGNDGEPMHEQHGGELSCQVCHSISYTSCDSCHVSISEETGNPKYTTAGTYMTFLIGRNVLKSYERPYEFVVVRHIPVDPDSYSYYGENLLPAFDALPTWAYATPHNIQLETPQTETCNSCHGNADLFLTIDKVKPSELDANLNVIIETVPGPVKEPAVEEE